LFAFAMSVVAAMRWRFSLPRCVLVHGEEAADNLSYCALVDEVAARIAEMMLALPPHDGVSSMLHHCQTATLLREIARHGNLKLLTKVRRGPKNLVGHQLQKHPPLVHPSLTNNTA